MKRTLLVVDDSVFIWQALKTMLEGTDYDIVACVKSGEEAIELYGKLKPDIVTMDIILPGMDGIESSKILLQNWPDAKIVIVSSLAYDEMMTQADALGAYGFIFKPFEAEQVTEALDKIKFD